MMKRFLSLILTAAMLLTLVPTFTVGAIAQEFVEAENETNALVNDKKIVRKENSKLIYNVREKYVYNLTLGMTVGEFLAEFDGNYSVLDANGEEISDGTMATGYKIVLKSENEIIDSYTVVVFGDIDGDGDVNVNDIGAIRTYVATGALSGAYLLAANADRGVDGDVNVNDIGIIRNHVSGANALNQGNALEFTLLENGTYSVSMGAANYDDTVIIPNTYMGKAVTEIADNAFSGNENIKSVTLYPNIEKIGASAFCGCINLSDIHYFGTQLQWNDVRKETQWDTNCGEYTLHLVEELAYYTEGLVYTELPNGTLCVSDIGTAADTEIVIPSVYDGKIVTEIGKQAFISATITGVIIPNTVVKIGDEAFRYCYYIEKLEFPNSISEIGAYAFYQNEAIKYITLGTGLKIIGYAAFASCLGVEDIYYRGTTEQWNNIAKGSYWDEHYQTNARSGYVKLNYTFHASENYTEGLEYTALTNNTYAVSGFGTAKDTEIIIPFAHEGKDVTEIQKEAFENNENINSIDIPYSVNEIEDDTFSGCKKLAKITVVKHNAAYQSVDDNLYNKGATALVKYASGKAATDFTVPSTVNTIAKGAFRDSESLQNVTIHSSVDTIYEAAFAQSGIQNLYFIGTEEQWSNIYKDENWNSGFEGNFHYGEKEENYTEGLEYYDLGDGTYMVIGIGTATNETDIIIPATYNGKPVVEIDRSAFEGCKNIVSITIPDSVLIIGNVAFADCTSLKSIDFGNGVWKIGHSILEGCSSLTTVTIPASVTSLGNNGFLKCTSLTEILVDESNTVYQSIDGNLYTKNGVRLIQYAPGKTATTFTVPEGILYIEAYAFGYNTTLCEIILSSTVKSIGSRAFTDCTSLKTLHFPKSLQEIGSYAVQKCTSLADIYYGGSQDEWQGVKKGTNWNKNAGAFTIHYTEAYTEGLKFTLLDNDTYSVSIGDATDTEIVIPSTYNGKAVTEIGMKAFSGAAITGVYIPNTITIIKNDAFYQCTSLVNVTFEENSQLETIREFAFAQCKSLESITLPESVKYFEGEWIFQSCEKLKSIVIPEGITSIGNYMFYCCYALQSVTIPESVTSIGIFAFRYCENLTDIYFGGDKAQWNAIAFGSSWNQYMPQYIVHCADGDIMK